MQIEATCIAEPYILKKEDATQWLTGALAQQESMNLERVPKDILEIVYVDVP